MGRCRHFIPLLVWGLVGLMTPAVGSASDAMVETQEPLPSRLPLLDEAGLDKYSRPPAQQPTEAVVDKEYPPNTVIPLDTKNLRYFSYFAKVQRRIDQSYYYPKDAAKDLLNGIVGVSFDIQRDGSVGEVKIIGSSGKEVLDETAVSIINRAAPFSPLPSRIQHSPIRVVTHVRFIPSGEAIQQRRGLDLLSIPLD